MLPTWGLAVTIIACGPHQVSAQDQDCPDGWVNGEGESCFGFFPDDRNVTWWEAQEICENNDGYLAEPKTVEQMTFLSGLAALEESFTGIHSWWIGLTDLGHEGVWQWSHSIEVATTSFWSQGSPSNMSHNNLDCGYVYHKNGVLSWQDIDCAEEQSHGGSIAPVCQRGEVGTQTTPEVLTTTTFVSDATTEPTTTNFAGCPFGWLEFEGSCFYVSGQKLSAIEASDWCKSYNSELASIHSPYENDFVRSQAHAINGDNYWWLGGTDMNSEGDWTWMDGTEWDFEGWYSGQGNDGNAENCVVLRSYSTYGWYDTSCVGTQYFVCRIN